MRKIKVLVAILAFVLGANYASAQDKNMFNHLSAGISLGVLDGIGFEVAAPIGNYVNARTGLSFLPGISYKDDVKYMDGGVKKEVEVEGKIGTSPDWKLLFDIHPFKSSSFRFTVGAFVGKSEMVKGYNTEPVDDYANSYIKIDDSHRVGFDENGFTKAQIKVKSIKPYAGIGFGRAISRKHPLVFNFDMGVMFWGKPEAWGRDYSTGEMGKVKKEDFDAEEADEAFKWIEKFHVAPVLSMRLVYNIF